MARPKTFDPAVALERAMEVFWDRGYEAASLQDLLIAMKLSRSSFYQTYGSKHELLLAALERYADTELSEMLSPLMEPDSGRDAIVATFRKAVRILASERGRRGCFANNCAVELGGRDAAAEHRVREIRTLVEDAFYGAVRRAQERDEIAATRDPRALARFLVTSLSGLQAVAKGAPGYRALDDVVDIIAGTLR